MNKNQYQQHIENRILDEAHYIVDNITTVRDTAKKFGVSKSTVHKDITERLLDINSTLAEEVNIVMGINLEERHIRGGKSTQRKYKSVM
jgi:putative DeoR family transcriptional regulator (stage III sporulation protein D)